jgi:hypothetical protein
LSCCGSFVSTGVAESTVSILRAEIAKQLPYKNTCYITVITTIGTFTAMKTSNLKLNKKFVSCIEGATLTLKYSLLMPVQVTITHGKNEQRHLACLLYK